MCQPNIVKNPRSPSEKIDRTIEKSANYSAFSHKSKKIHEDLGIIVYFYIIFHFL